MNIARNRLGCGMEVRQKMIGGRAHYDIVEAFQRGSRIEYRTVVPLGSDPDPEVALANHQAALIDATRALTRLQPLQEADPAIARKCNNLKFRLHAEQDRIGLLLDAIERLKITGGKDAPGPDDP
ncbi:MAG: hypothetical protein HN527_03000 [Rhodospirillaceae bacterium]|nr:hypothetical protein [Rhodospirillaceae bacterium]